MVMQVSTSDVIDPSQHPHAYVHVLKDEVQYPVKIGKKGLFNKKPQLVEYKDTIELVNEGIKKYGDRYIGTCDSFIFDKPKPVRLFSRCSYDELVTVFRWRHEFDKDRTNTSDYDTAVIFGNKIEKLALFLKKFQHINSELMTMYPCTKDPSDPDYDESNKATTQMGPPSDLEGPDGKPFGDFMSRLIYDSILIQLYLCYWTEDKKYRKKAKSLLVDFIKNHESFTKLPEFKINEINEIIDTIN